MAIKAVIFLAAILALTLGAHLLFYKAVARVFDIAGPALKTALLAVLLLLALSFMASFFLLQWQENSLAIGFYKFSAIWIGLFLNLSFALNQEIGADLQLSGHSHAGQLFPFGTLTKFIYKGHDYGFHRLSRFAIYTTSGVGTWGPPLRTGNSPEIVVMELK